MQRFISDKKIGRLAAVVVVLWLCQGCRVTVHGAYLVRHAEKVTRNPDDLDPALTPAGMERAIALKNKLANANIAAIYSTDYRRTMATAKPLADYLGLPITVYDQSSALVTKIKAEHGGETVLIVGHSNTVPQIVQEFGVGAPVPMIAPDDYDEFYVVLATSDGDAIFATATYGAPSRAPG